MARRVIASMRPRFARRDRKCPRPIRPPRVSPPPSWRRRIGPPSRFTSPCEPAGAARLRRNDLTASEYPLPDGVDRALLNSGRPDPSLRKEKPMSPLTLLLTSARPAIQWTRSRLGSSLVDRLLAPFEAGLGVLESCRVPVPVPIPYPPRRPHVAGVMALAVALFAAAAPVQAQNYDSPRSWWDDTVDGRLVDVQVLVDGNAAPLYTSNGRVRPRLLPGLQGPQLLARAAQQDRPARRRADRGRRPQRRQRRASRRCRATSRCTCSTRGSRR